MDFKMSSFFKRYIFPSEADLQKQSPEVLCKKGVLRNFPKFTGKHPCQFASEECTYLNLTEMIVMKSHKSRKSRGTVGPPI